MSAPEAEGGQDYDDILGFPGDGFKDKDDANPAEALLRPGNRLWMVVTQKCMRKHLVVARALPRNPRQVLLFLPMTLW